MKGPWKKLSSKIVHENPYYKVRQDKVIKPDGSKGEYNVVVRVDSVFIIAVNKKKEVCLVDLYRYTTKMRSLEIPAGSTDGQKPLLAARRELKEETGLTAKKWKKIGEIQASNGIMDTLGHFFLATGLTKTAAHKQREEGIYGTKMLPFKKIKQLIRQGKINDAYTIVAWAYAALELGL
jgi:8-oxo-dGTP pyrophosphatase MutT (NUDIX family)